MKYFKLIALWMIFDFSILGNVSATRFNAPSFEDQVDRVDVIIHGIFKNLNYRRLPSGEVFTDASFEIISSVGIERKMVVNPNNFKVSYPGGQWDGITYHIHGAPKFKSNEEVVLFVNKGKFGFYIDSLGVGKYKVKRDKKIIYLQSEIFPKHKKLGKVSYKKMNQLVIKKFNKQLNKSSTKFHTDKFVYKKKIVSKRIPANIEKFKNTNEINLNYFFGFGTILLCAFLIQYFLRRER